MRYKNYYEILGVTRKSSKDEIKLAYRKLAKKYHPDATRDDGTSTEEMFKDVTEAYDVLTNDEKRRKYDRQVNRLGYGFVPNDNPLSNIRYEIKSGASVFSDIFTTILGFKKDDDTHFSENIDDKNAPIRGKDITSNLEISLEEGLLGTEKKIAIKGYKGGIKTFSVNVPTGIHDGEKIRLAALGQPGRNGGKNGDLIITVHITPHEIFKIQGNDLVEEIYISPATAIIGQKYKTKLFNDTIFVDLPKYLKNGEYIVSEGNGYVDGEGKRGNLLLHINIKMPQKVSEREEKLYEQIAKLERKSLDNNHT